MRLAAIGVGCGLIGAWFAVRLRASLLFQVSVVDPLTYALASAGLVAVCLLATYLPSRRAAAVDPSTALRAE